MGFKGSICLLIFCFYEVEMAKKRENIKLKSTESSEIYSTVKNPKTKTGRLELKKYDKTLRKHVIFKEAK